MENLQRYVKVHSFESGVSFNIKIIVRILFALRKNGPMKITNLAMSSHLNHVACKKYVGLLVILEWIELRSDKKSTMISITSRGLSTLEKFHFI